MKGTWKSILSQDYNYGTMILKELIELCQMWFLTTFKPVLEYQRCLTLCNP